MFKYQKVSVDVEEKFESVRNQTAIPQWVEIQIMCYDKLKQISKTVKMSDLVEAITDGINFVVVINEKIFDQLDDQQQTMVLEEALAGIRISDRDALSLETPDFNTYTGFLEKYGNIVITLKESIKTLFEVEKQKEEEEKAATKTKRSKKGGG